MNWHDINPQRSRIDPEGSTRDPFWLTSQFSNAELDGKRVLINWLRQGALESSALYVIKAGAYGHSRHIQSIRAEPEDARETGDASVDFDQADADQLRRTNEKPEEYSFIANLDLDRTRVQSGNLEKLVHERRARKREDEAGRSYLASSFSTSASKPPRA
ncbi:MAG: hypothetical protein K8R87_11770 [Verrucomicrobia bacterium]|nr:hypothetical protein [Verrucomicrobiota bacterium]